jgi:transcriptional antiterminator NusG
MMHDPMAKDFHDPESALPEVAKARARVEARKWFRDAAAARTDMALWYVAKTNRACPMTMADSLNEVGIEAWCPVDRDKKRAPRKHGRKLVEWPMFDGYLFVRIDCDPASILGVTSFKGIAGILGRDGEPVAMPDKFINELKVFAWLSPKQRRLMCAAVKIGDRVKIKRYAFAAFLGDVVGTDMNNGWVDIEFDIFGRLVPVRVGLDEIEN